MLLRYNDLCVSTITFSRKFTRSTISGVLFLQTCSLKVAKGFKIAMGDPSSIGFRSLSNQWTFLCVQMITHSLSIEPSNKNDLLESTYKVILCNILVRFCINCISRTQSPSTSATTSKLILTQINASRLYLRVLL